MEDSDLSIDVDPALEERAGTLSGQDRAVLAVLVGATGRVVSRHELARRSGLADRSERRTDAILVRLRRALGPGAIRTVRSRGWTLLPSSVDQARALLDG